MTKIAVRCDDWAEARRQYFKIVHTLQEKKIPINRLIFHQDIVGTKKCRVRFYSMTGDMDWLDSKVDLAIGFDMKEQREMLTEGKRASRRYVRSDKDYTDEILKYFLD